MRSDKYKIPGKKRQVDFFFKLVDPINKKGLEVGPLDKPIVDHDYYNVKYVDYFDEKTLRKKNQHDPNRNVNEIVKLDYILGNNKLTDVIIDEKFDYVIAVHVLEHLPNLFGWLNDLEQILNPGGILFAAVPDYRYTFDIDRPKTSIGELIENYMINRERPSARHPFDQRFYHRKVIARELWNNYDLHKNETVRTFNVKQSFELFEKAQQEYVDCHCTVFDPESFKESIEVSRVLKLHKFRIENLYETERNHLDFIVLLKIRRESIDG